MGLDKDIPIVFQLMYYMKLSLDSLGLGLSRLVGRRKRARVSPITRERELFEREVKSQFEELKKKGISIPVFTL